MAREPEPKFKIGDKIRLTDYSIYSDYVEHAGQTAEIIHYDDNVETGDAVNMIMKWPDGKSSVLFMDEHYYRTAYIVEDDASKEFDRLKAEVEGERGAKKI